MCRAAAKEIALLVRPSRKKPAGCTLLLPAADEPPGILANNFLSEQTTSSLQNTGLLQSWLFFRCGLLPHGLVGFL